MLRLWLQMAFTEGLGPVAGAVLLKTFGSPEALFSSSATHLTACGLRPKLVKRLLSPDARREALIEQCLQWATQPDAHIIPCTDPDYPTGLTQIHDPPLVIFVRGARHWLTRPMLAVVGSRNASIQGAQTALDMTQTLAQAGWTIVSGLALGIDAAAHRGALQTPGGTIGVLGCGIDRIYPRSHRQLAEQILQCGALLSELPPGTPPAAAFFPQRNRLIAGLVQGVVVVEAALQSGSLITARLANECGREVLAVPGPVRSALSRGCHQLIREGATLVESAAQVLEVCPAPIPEPANSVPVTVPVKVPVSVPDSAPAPNAGLASPSTRRVRVAPLPCSRDSETALDQGAVAAQDALQARILQALQGGAAHPDQLARYLELPVHSLAAPLLALELQGRVMTDAQGQLSPFDPGRQLASAQFRLL